jgi:uncharacterized membrane protein
MAKDLTDTLGDAVGRLARGTAQSVTSSARKVSKSPLSGPKGLAAGAGLVALAPIAAKGAGRLVKQQLADGGNPVKKAKEAVSDGPVKKAKEAVGGTVKETVGDKIDKAGGAAGMAKEAGKGLLPGGGGDSGGGDKQAGAQIGSTRRMPIQQAIDVAVPIDTAYNQWTQFEEWPNFMHRLDSVSQEDETHISFKAKLWGIPREFTAEIVEQRPDERIKWRVTEGVNHTGVVTFHQLSERLTRVDVDIDIQPGSLLEKAGRGMRHAKRAIRADLSRFKAYIELEEEETGAWRGQIDDGEVKRRRASGSGSRSSGRTRASSSRGRSRSAAASSGGSSRTARSSRSSGSAKSSGRSSGSSKSARSSGSSKSSGRSSSGRTASASKSSGRAASARSSGSSNGSTRSSRAKSSSNGASASRSTKRKTTSSRS